MTTLKQLQTIMPLSKARALLFLEPLNAAMLEFGIDTPVRQAMFLAQAAHESGQLNTLVESLSYRAERIREIGNASPAGSRWRSLVPRADELAGSSVRLGNAVYGGRMGNGPEASGDGYLYRGRGIFQNTGRMAYIVLMMALGIDCVQRPELLEIPENACRAAGHYWKSNNLNKWADAGDFDGVCDLVNLGSKTSKIGDSHGYAERYAIYKTALKVLS